MSSFSFEMILSKKKEQVVKPAPGLLSSSSLY